MAANVVTIEDLYIFKKELLTELKELIINQPIQQKKWLKSTKVRELLGISSGTLYKLRMNGTLPYSKIGGAIYYAYEDILAIMEKNQQSSKVKKSGKYKEDKN
jgi:predicted DNA-binding transcriptional regulator AlpA